MRYDSKGWGKSKKKEFIHRNHTYMYICVYIWLQNREAIIYDLHVDVCVSSCEINAPQRLNNKE